MEMIAMMMAALNRDTDSEKILLSAGAFAAHLQPIQVEEEWVDMDKLLAAEEAKQSGVAASGSGLAAIGGVQGAAAASLPAPKGSGGGLSKFKGLSKKVAQLS